MKYDVSTRSHRGHTEQTEYKNSVDSVAPLCISVVLAIRLQNMFIPAIFAVILEIFAYLYANF